MSEPRTFGKYIADRASLVRVSTTYPESAYVTPLSIAFAFVATHNHFVLDRGGKVFNRSAPVIKLPAEATEDDHLALLGLLNSSTACFWMKQVFCHDKGERPLIRKGARQTNLAGRTSTNSQATGLDDSPFPSDIRPTLLASSTILLNGLARSAPDGVLHRWQSRGIMPGSRIKDSFDVCERDWNAIREQMIALQEELDWECYRLYGLANEDLTYGAEPPPLRFGWRALRDRDAAPRWSRGSCRRPGSSGTERHRSLNRTPGGRRTIKISSFAGWRSSRQTRTSRSSNSPSTSAAGTPSLGPISSRERYGPGSSTVSNPTSISTAG